MYPKCALNTVPQSSRVQFSISNQSNQSWRLLKWHTPFDAWFSEFIHVTLAGEPVAYGGALAKRGQPNDEDYLILEAGEEVKIELELSEAFQLGTGLYRIELEPLHLMLDKDFINQKRLVLESQNAHNKEDVTEYKMFKIQCTGIDIEL